MIQGTAITSEFLSAFGQNRSGSERLTTSQKCLKTARSGHLLLGLLLQGTELVVQSTTEASLERLVPLVHFLAAWEAYAKCISMGPGKRVQDSVRSRPASVQRGISHTGGPRAGSGNEIRSRYSLEEGGSSRVVPPCNRESGFYSRYFIVPKKGGGCVQF